MSTLKTAWYWCGLPVRMLMYGCSFVFGHPMAAMVLFAGAAALAFWGQRPQLAVGAIAIMGLLLMWVAETKGGINTAWPARSPFAPPLPVAA